MAALAEDWPDPEWRVLFNRGVPALEWSFPHEDLVRVAREVRPTAGDRLMARIEGPADDAVTFGLACGAPLAVHGAVPWNDLGVVYGDYLERMRSLREDWGVTNAEDWLVTMNSLLGEEGGDPRTTLVLALRHEEARRTGERPGPERWRATIEAWSRDNDVPPDPLLELTETIGRYEERFRAEALLPADGDVHSVAAYDFGRAVHMARWGREAHFCDQATAERLVISAGEGCRRHYDSWEALSAGYALGRVLRRGGEEFGAVLAAHRILTEAADGPWQTVGWETGW
jgi:hypothetical protein